MTRFATWLILALIAIAAVGALILTAVPSPAQGVPNPSQCAARDKVAGVLSSKYGETPRAMGVSGDVAIMTLWANDATGSWTITETSPAGVMCIRAYGTGFDAVAAVVPGDPV